MELNNLELNSAELNGGGGGGEAPPLSNETLLAFSFSSGMLPDVRVWSPNTTPLRFIQRVWVPTTHYEFYGLWMRYAPFVPQRVTSGVTLDYEVAVVSLERLKWGLSTDFRPYNVSKTNPVEVHATVQGVRTWQTPLPLRYTLLSTNEAKKEATLTYSMGLLKDGEHEFSLQYGAFDFIPLHFEFGATAELLTAEDSIIELPTTIGILSDKQYEDVIPVSYDQPVLTTWLGQTSGMSYGVGVLQEVSPEVTLDYWLRNEEYMEFGFFSSMDQSVHHGKVSFAWAKFNSADVTFNLNQKMDYGSGRVEFGLACAVERAITSGVVICTGMNVRSGLQLSAIIRDHVLGYSLVDSPLHSKVMADTILGLGLNRVVSGSSISLSLRNRLISGLEVFLPTSTSVRDFGTALELPWSLRARSGVVLDNALRNWVLSGVSLPLDILDSNHVLSGLTLVVPLNIQAPIVQEATRYLVVNGEPVEIVSGEVALEDGAYGWTGSFELAFPQDLALFTPDTEFSITLGAEAYSFVVETKTLKRTSVSSVVGAVNGISPSAILASPRATPITKSWTTSGTARSIVTEVLAGYPLQWDVPDWAIPAHRYSVTQKYPMDIARDFAAAIGAVVDSLPDGTLRVRSKYKESPESISGATADHSYLDQLDIFNITEDYTPRREFNLFRITDGQSGTNTDTMEYETITPMSGNLRVYPSPFRTDIDVYSTANVFVGTPYYDLRTETEVIEIKDFVGNTRFPVLAITGVEWLDTSLAGLVGGEDSKKITSTDPDNGYSLVRVTYTVRSMMVPVSGADGKQAQFLIRRK